MSAMNCSKTQPLKWIANYLNNKFKLLPIQNIKYRGIIGTKGVIVNKIED